MPGNVAVNHRRASISLNITVVGGSIAGAAAAYALRKAGHQVTILEKTDGKSWSAGGLRSPPNMTRILNQWGLGPALESFGHKCTHFVFQNGETGKLIAFMKLHEEFLKDLMADFLFIQHGDLHSTLCELALHEGVQFRYNSKVIHVDSETVSVTLESGEKIASDMVIGADGFNSLVRTSVIGKKVPETRERDVSLNFTISTDLMREDEDLRSLADNSDQWAVWLGDGYMLHGSIVNSGRDFSLMLGYLLSEDAPEYNEEWTDEYPLEHFNLDLEKFEPRVRKLFKMADKIKPHIYINRPHLESFACDRARLVLVGEAAHPLLPSGQYNTALGIEDAQTLGSLFSGIQGHEQVPQLLAAYEELRQSRCIATQDLEKRKRIMLTLPMGSEQMKRDVRLRNAMAYGEQDHMDEKTFKAIWGDEMDLVMYDASEKVEDWWTKWGPVLVRENPNRRSMAPSLEVSISKGR
ncbi:putative FAD binding domain containing protein [Lyophyllum shimeji]|uniref:FAD binding domain containing protein n=1 Tax=Lyophyllum shimeji TaxID=47721 RepID=A0A9P3UMZ0_LYOSH|nr:putative FAD binding domain containing protein [Lyophyllum shimeji]